MPKIQFTLNGQPAEASCEPGMHLLEVLREECGVLSPKNGCAPEGTCGCCLVQIDGTPALSCLRKAEQIAGRRVVTLEGVADDMRRVLAEAFVLEGGVQCGFCIPGIMIRAASLIDHGKTADRAVIAKALDGHLCRCTGYGRIIDAIQTAGEAWQNGRQIDRVQPRRHLFFGEEFGRTRNPALANGTGAGDGNGSANGNGNSRGRARGGRDGIGTSILRLGGLEQALGEKPFVDDLSAPGMLHGAMV